MGLQRWSVIGGVRRLNRIIREIGKRPNSSHGPLARRRFGGVTQIFVLTGHEFPKVNKLAAAMFGAPVPSVFLSIRAQPQSHFLSLLQGNPGQISRLSPERVD